jgi:hypothetical protein
VIIPQGHALRISIAGSNYDRFDRNMQDGSDLSDEPGAVAVPGMIAILTGPRHPSELILPLQDAAYPLGIRLDLPAFTRPVEDFQALAWLDNPAPESRTLPTVFLLDVLGAYYFWPSWEQTLEWRNTTVPPGSTPLQVIAAFTWPDGTSSTPDDLVLYGAFLTDDLRTIAGRWDHARFGYGP